MNGLERRYTLEEILAFKRESLKIKPPLNYNALNLIRDPLYVKFGQTLKEEAADQRTNIIADQEFKLLLQKIASERNVPYDLLEELIRNMPKGGGGDGGNDPGGSGFSGSGPSGGGGGDGGSSSTRDYSGGNDYSMSTFSDTESVRSEMPPPSSSKKRSERPDGDNQGPQPPPMAPAATLRSNLEIEAQIQELRDELRKQNREEKIVREFVQAPREENPIKEIIREFHQIVTPSPLPQVPARQDESLINAQLIQALQQAMARNENLALMAQHMGMTMTQLVEYMKAQLRRPEESASSSSSSGPPPQPPPQPPPPPPIAVSNERRNRTRSPYAPGASLPPPPPPPLPAPAAVIENVIADAKASLPPEKSRTRSPKRTGTTAKAKAEPPPPPKRGRDPTPIPINTAPPSRAVSLASTIPYDDQEQAQEKLARSRSARKQAAGAAVEEIVLPIEGGTARGRSPVNKVDRIMNAIAESQNRALVKGQIRHQLGNFAKSFAKSQKQNKAQKRAATIEPAPPSRVKTFDEIAEIVDRAPSTEPAAAASFQKRIPLVGGSDIVRRRLK